MTEYVIVYRVVTDDDVDPSAIKAAADEALGTIDQCVCAYADHVEVGDPLVMEASDYDKEDEPAEFRPISSEVYLETSGLSSYRAWKRRDFVVIETAGGPVTCRLAVTIGRDHYSGGISVWGEGRWNALMTVRTLPVIDPKECNLRSDEPGVAETSALATLMAEVKRQAVTFLTATRTTTRRA